MLFIQVPTEFSLMSLEGDTNITLSLFYLTHLMYFHARPLQSTFFFLAS